MTLEPKQGKPPVPPAAPEVPPVVVRMEWGMSFNVSANIVGVNLSRSFSSFQLACAAVDSLASAGALYAEVQHHVKYGCIDTVTRGGWLTVYAKGDIINGLGK